MGEIAARSAGKGLPFARYTFAVRQSAAASMLLGAEAVKETPDPIMPNEVRDVASGCSADTLLVESIARVLGPEPVEG